MDISKTYLFNRGLTASSGLAVLLAAMTLSASNTVLGDHCDSDSSSTLTTSDVTVFASGTTLEAEDCGIGEFNLDSSKGKASKWSVNTYNIAGASISDSPIWAGMNKLEFEENENGEISYTVEVNPQESIIQLTPISWSTACDGNTEDCLLKSGKFSFQANGKTLVMLKAGLNIAWYYFDNLPPGTVLGTWDTDNLLFNGQDLSHATVFFTEEQKESQ